ncbi:GFA family protein [Pseudoroseicyclus tamaricis]|uniref:GFA family protein n=1 Tax=Pseudoroseicyclus tamaricis TaxID=2705421 RepID=A0A6B2JQ32_9RHOB|nr:GFA family protein [Pseudoroseicyclus tamaricis]NDV00787.1 GFA family protein [Pseudoroseicyclus tamaricis]
MSAAVEGSCHCGAVRWHWAGAPESATACNCGLCRRAAALWAYGWEGEAITVSGPTRSFLRGDREIEFHHCPTCGGLAYWRAVAVQPDGRRRMAVNLRMAEPEAVADLPVRHVDMLRGEVPGYVKGRVADLWF